jgi:hypothetical protein
MEIETTRTTQVLAYDVNTWPDDELSPLAAAAKSTVRKGHAEFYDNGHECYDNGVGTKSFRLTPLGVTAGAGKLWDEGFTLEGTVR